MTNQAESQTAFMNALVARGPRETDRDKLSLFGRFVGSWRISGRFFADDGSLTREYQGEWHFGWVLEGRAIQDVLIRPARELPTDASVHEYGTTLRVYDSRIRAWHIVWVAAVSGGVVHLLGREDGDAILIEGQGPDGLPYRWTFAEIEDDAFLWQGSHSPDEGRSWILGHQMNAHRASRA